MRASSSGVKRARTDESLDPLASPRSLTQASPLSSNSISAASTSFRNVSACNRCRLRKNRCDQNLPACSSCKKAGVKCVGFDPITKRETPRTYVYYLENRVSYLESLLANNGIPVAPSQDFDLGAKPAAEPFQSQSPAHVPRTNSHESPGAAKAVPETSGQARESWEKEKYDERKLDRLVSNIGMVSVQGTSDPRYLGSTSGISFARYAV